MRHLKLIGIHTFLHFLLALGGGYSRDNGGIDGNGREKATFRIVCAREEKIKQKTSEHTFMRLYAEMKMEEKRPMGNRRLRRKEMHYQKIHDSLEYQGAMVSDKDKWKGLCKTR